MLWDSREPREEQHHVIAYRLPDPDHRQGVENQAPIRQPGRPANIGGGQQMVDQPQVGVQQHLPDHGHGHQGCRHWQEVGRSQYGR